MGVACAPRRPPVLGALAPNPFPGILRKRDEAVGLFKDGHVQPSRLDAFKAAEGLVVLGEDADHPSEELLMVAIRWLSMALTRRGQ